MKCYYPTDKSGNRIGFKTPEACIFDTSGKNLTNKLNQLRSDVNGKAAANHGTHVPAPQTANNKIYLRNDNTWHTITPGDIGAAASSHSHSWDSITGKPSLYTTSQIDSKISAINSNISNMTTVVDYSDKWVRSDTGPNIHTRDYSFCSCIKIGSVCTVQATGHVSGTWDSSWESTDTHPWILSHLPKPKNGRIEFSGWALKANVAYPMRFLIDVVQTGTIKPWYNSQVFSDPDTFSFCVTYVTAD